MAELSRQLEVSQVMISRWKSEFLKLSQSVFDDKHLAKDTGTALDINALRAKVGQLTMERDFLEDACRRSSLKVK